MMTMDSIWFPVDAAHIAGFLELTMHAVGHAERERLMVDLLDASHVVAQLILEVRMHAVVDDQLGTLQRILTAQVGHALIGDDDRDRVLAVIQM